MFGNPKPSGAIAPTDAPESASVRPKLNAGDASEGEASAAALGGAHTIIFILAVALFIGVRLWQLTSFGLFGDEAFTVNVARSGWGELIEKVVADIVHPPLFYALLKVWIVVGGQSELWLKLLPC